MKAPSEEIYGKSMQGKVYSVDYNAVADTPSGGTPCDINVICALQVHLVCYNFVADIMGLYSFV